MLKKYLSSFKLLSDKEAFRILISKEISAKLVPALLVAIFAEVITIAVYLFSNDFNIDKDDSVYYMIILGVILIIMCSVFSSVFFMLRKDYAKNIKLLNIVIYSVIVLFILWGICVSLLGQLTTNSLTVYILVIALLSVFITIPPVSYTAVYLPTYIIFIAAMTFIQKDSAVLLDHCINSGALLLICTFLNISLYRAQVRDFNSDLLVKKKNDELESLNEELERMSNTDSLTGIYNRRKFDELICEVFSKKLRVGDYVSLIMIDVDSFKQYNDYYGHVMGDECLARVAAVLRNCCKRNLEYVARYGGEEFVVLLVSCTLENAFATAEHIRASIASEFIEHLKSDIEPYITVSLGVASTENNSYNDYEQLIQAADMNLYKAKAAGKNKSCC